MTSEIFFALLGFAFVTSVTPGPNNMMLLASGVNFGLRRTVPHMLGISVGHAVMVTLMGLGLSGLFQTVPQALKRPLMLRSASWTIHCGTTSPASSICTRWVNWRITNRSLPPAWRQ